MGMEDVSEELIAKVAKLDGAVVRYVESKAL